VLSNIDGPLLLHKQCGIERLLLPTVNILTLFANKYRLTICALRPTMSCLSLFNETVSSLLYNSSHPMVINVFSKTVVFSVPGVHFPVPVEISVTGAMAL